MMRLWQRFKRRGDPQARHQLILHHLPLVRFVQARLPISLPSAVTPEDLTSAGVVGLIRAVDEFDPDRAVEFATFAVPCIRGAMFDQLREHDTVPRSVRQRANAIEAAYVELSDGGRKSPAIEDVAAAVGQTPEEAERTMVAVGLDSLVSLGASYRTPRSSHDQTLESTADVQATTPLAALMAKERDGILTEAVAALPPADRRVIVLYYRDGLMLKEIAEVLSVTKARVSQIHARALFRLRAHLAAIHQSRSTRRDASRTVPGGTRHGQSAGLETHTPGPGVPSR